MVHGRNALRARAMGHHESRDNAPMNAPTTPKDPLQGMTLEAVLTALVAAYGWAGLGQRITLRCFTHDPSMGSSLKFLRRTPWARDKVESLYLYMLRETRRQRGGANPAADQ